MAKALEALPSCAAGIRSQVRRLTQSLMRFLYYNAFFTAQVIDG